MTADAPATEEPPAVGTASPATPADAMTDDDATARPHRRPRPDRTDEPGLEGEWDDETAAPRRTRSSSRCATACATAVCARVALDPRLLLYVPLDLCEREMVLPLAVIG